MIINMTSSVFEQIKNTIGVRKSERGGMMGTSDGKTIDNYYFDQDAKTTSVLYEPNVKVLNGVLNGDWLERKISLAGFIHSHPIGFNHPSIEDEKYAISLMKDFDQDYFYMPIVQSGNEGHFSIHSYFIAKDGKKFSLMPATLTIDGVEYDPTKDTGPFTRIENVVDLDLLSKSTIIGIGCGGGRDFYLDLARSGVSNFIIFDADNIGLQNMSSQGVYQSEIGLNKAEATKRKIHDINPKAKVRVLTRFLDDRFDDGQFETLLTTVPDIEQVIIVAMTDNFYAQSRSSRLALKYGLKYIGSQHFTYGVGSEITYWYPGVSMACPRCLTQFRYRAYLEEGYFNDASSNSAPIFITRRLDAVCEKIALGMLHYQSQPDHIYATFLKAHSDRNYILLRHNDYFDKMSGFADAFSSNQYRFNDDIVWLSLQDIGEDSICPDCGNHHEPSLIAQGIADSRLLDQKKN